MTEFPDSENEQDREPTPAHKAGSLLKSIDIGEPVSHGALTVFPLFFPQEPCEPYTILEDAMHAGQVEITEVDEHGSVPELLLLNKGAQNLLLVDGEELVGAKQNRIVNITILVAANERTRIPVSCVEQGRWSYRFERFRSGTTASSTLRSKVSRSVKKNIRERQSYNSDQGEVWDEVHCFMKDIGEHSETGAMSDGYRAREKTIKEFTGEIKLPEGTAGYIACINGRVMGGDLFDAPETLSRKWARLAQGAAADALRARGKPRAASRKSVERFLRQAVNSVAGEYISPGLGRGVSVEGEQVTGNILMLGDKLVHASLFPCEV